MVLYVYMKLLHFMRISEKSFALEPIWNILNVTVCLKNEIKMELDWKSLQQ